ncbi:hypothetical protein Rsub_12284 [Raphidocelis subcapitata]|uniref:Fe2OG dioxygenase domain-containing protein n=1 Tax=Raphidocelis subcapitata TaxID=307507 RepID=A0A2V0PIG4_9CHLO|nr:hypothetical protein Rsub_12284 [Raphidocelis subcapitata]|eukprot:GBF99506.1 hypothetical protein Rsub_12284 [Raphidocelis subcapitata]
MGPAALDLEAFRVPGSPVGDLFLVPDYVSGAEEETIARRVAAQRSGWVQLSGRRLQNHGGTVTAKGFLVPAPMPDWLAALAARVAGDVPALAAAGGANHVLINAYAPGEGIMAHSDGPLYAPIVSILSLGSPCVIRFWRKQEEGGAAGLPPAASLALPRRSLLVFSGDAYESCLHGIEEAFAERLDGSVVNVSAVEAEAVRQEDQQQRSSGGGGGVSSGGGGAGAERAEPGSGGGGGGVSGGGAGGGGGGGAEGAEPGAPRGAPAPAREGSGGGDSGGGGERCGGAAAAAGPAGPGLVLPRTGERVSLTIRRVLKVHKGLRLPGAPR